MNELWSTFGDKLDSPERADQGLKTVWEWGRTVLLFHLTFKGLHAAEIEGLRARVVELFNELNAGPPGAS